jgi:hypothetical protein
VGSILVSPSANLIIRVRDHTSASSGAGPMELVSMACPSVVRGRIFIIIIITLRALASTTAAPLSGSNLIDCVSATDCY